MIGHTAAVVVLAAGIPPCLLRLWWLRWTAICNACGLGRSVCLCA